MAEIEPNYIPSVEETLSFIREERPDFDNREFVQSVLDLMGKLEFAALNRKTIFPLDLNEAKKIKALCIFSAPGTAEIPFKEDRFKKYPWAKWMDRNRDIHGVSLCKQITEQIIGTVLKTPEQTREAILEYGPHLLYSGRPDEQEAFSRWIAQKGIMPIEKVHLIGGTIIDNTYDQVSKLFLPDQVKVNGEDQIGFILHAPQAVRTLYMMQKVSESGNGFLFEDPLNNPQSLRVRMFPMPTPRTQLNREGYYIKLETRGIVYYTFYAKPTLAGEKPFPFVY